MTKLTSFSELFETVETVGFSGTRRGLTIKQAAALREALESISPTTFQHGDCVGADSKAHGIAQSLGISIETRPCNLERLRAYCEAAATHPEEPPLDRNKKIVRSSDLMLICPAELQEQSRGGTWSTFRYAVTQNVPTIVIFRNGSIDSYGTDATNSVK
tara:strand:+ start:67301 stop:67777 length:477 start_codon:yes stop_codon:yes gene_type:complete